MLHRDIVVIGASAGGVEALKELVRGLPFRIDASLFVVLHFPPSERSHLPEILSKVSSMPAIHPKNHSPIRPRQIYVAPPDRHLLVRDGHVELWRGPKENHSRPAINPLFRSAAETYGSRVIGVVLTGCLDDGTAGLIEIKRRGGIAIVQDPDEAMFPSMPSSAVKQDHVDYVVKLSEIGRLLAMLNNESLDTGEAAMSSTDPYSFTDLTCPECRGPLAEHKEGILTELRCRVGHLYSLEAAVATHLETQERTLWSAVVALEEGAALLHKIAAQSEPPIAQRLSAQAEVRGANAKTIRAMIESWTDEIL